MKSATFLGLATFSILTSTSFAASSLAFPGQPFPDPFTVPSDFPGEEEFGKLNGSWSLSQGVNTDLLGFYVDKGGYRGVGVGALVDDYSGVMSSFSITSNTATVGIAGATISDWFFQINAPTIDAPDRNAFAIDLAGSGLSGNLLAIDFTYDSLNSRWQVDVNTFANGFIFEGGLYKLTAAFGAVSGVSGAITSFDGAFTNIFGNATPVFGAETFSSLTITADKGGATNWGNGYLSVVPEPSSAILVSLLPAVFAFRRRR